MAKNQNLEEFVKVVEGKVVFVKGTVKSTSFTPQSEMVFGGESPVYSGGNVYTLEIALESVSAVKKLNFEGWPHLEKGDEIKAYVFAGEESAYSRGMRPLRNSSRGLFEKRESPEYVARELKEQELAFKIEKVKNNEVVASYESEKGIN